jgi:hypothetical protein
VGSAVSSAVGSWFFPQPVSAKVTAKNAATAAIFSRIKRNLLCLSFLSLRLYHRIMQKESRPQQNTAACQDYL